MVTDPPTRLIIAVVLTVAIHVTVATAIPRLRSASEENGPDSEDKPKADTIDQNPMVLQAETIEGKEPVLIEFSYSDDGENQQAKTEDIDRYSYRIIPSPETSVVNPSIVRGNDNTKDVKDAQETQSHAEGSQVSDDSVLQWNVRRQIEFEKNLPGFHNWPKHMPDDMRPLSPFDDDDMRPLSPFDDDDSVIATKEESFTHRRQMKRDDGFMPSEKFLPPPRAGPYLYPLSIADREPYN